MGTVIICAVLIILSFIAIQSYRKDLKDGCCDSSETIKKLKVKDKNIDHYSIKKEVFIDGMVCKNCATRVENAFLQDDETYPMVDLAQNMLTLYLKQDMSDQTIKEKIINEGYFVLSIK